MSLLKKIKRIGKSLEKAVRPALKSVAPNLVGMIPGIGPVAKVALSAGAGALMSGGATAVATRVAGPVFNRQALNVVTNGVAGMSMAPMIAGGGRVIAGQVGRVARRYGGTVATVAAAGALLYDANGNPVRRRARSKGITASELKGFRRVNGILAKYCKVAPPTRKRTQPSRGKACR